MRNGDNILGPTQWLSPWLSPVKEAATLQSEYQQKQLKYTLEVICWLLSLTTQESEDSLSHQNQIIGFLGNENRRVETLSLLFVTRLCLKFWNYSAINYLGISWFNSISPLT
jgi:hypothetical protein